MSVTAIVLNWRDTAGTVQCVNALSENPKIERVIVVDNESDGEVRSALSGTSIEVIEVPENRGFAAGINTALLPEARASNYLLVINNDASISPSATNQLVRALEEEPTLGLVAPTLRNVDGSVQSRGGRVHPTGRLSQRVDPGPFDYVSWACVLLRPQAIRDIGGLDERFFMYWEDVEYALRMTGSEWRVRVLGDVDATHALSASGRKAGSRLRRYYVYGVLTLSQIRGGRWRAIAAVAVCRTLIGRLLALDVAGARAIIEGVQLALHPTNPAFRSALVSR